VGGCVRVLEFGRRSVLFRVVLRPRLVGSVRNTDGEVVIMLAFHAVRASGRGSIPLQCTYQGA
jgi:hypothetical protein